MCLNLKKVIFSLHEFIKQMISLYLKKKSFSTEPTEKTHVIQLLGILPTTKNTKCVGYN